MAVDFGMLDQTQPGLRVVQAEGPDAVGVLGLRDDLARWMQANGVRQWQPGEVPRSSVEAAVADGRVFVVRAPVGLVASVTIAWHDTLVWDTTGDDAGYIHGLMVNRSFAGKGVGASLLAWSEYHLAMRGRVLARLDCVRSNRKLRRYYETAGYRCVGYQDFPDLEWALDVALYEKRLVDGPGVRS